MCSCEGWSIAKKKMRWKELENEEEAVGGCRVKSKEEKAGQGRRKRGCGGRWEKILEQKGWWWVEETEDKKAGWKRYKNWADVYFLQWSSWKKGGHF